MQKGMRWCQETAVLIPVLHSSLIPHSIAYIIHKGIFSTVIPDTNYYNIFYMITWTIRHFQADTHLLNTPVGAIICMQVKTRYIIPSNLFCVITTLLKAAVIFHFQDDNLSSRFSKLNLMNIGTSPNSNLHLKYYFTHRTCWTSNIYSMLTHKGLRTQLC